MAERADAGGTKIADGPATWLHGLLGELIEGDFPMLNHITNEVNDLEDTLFKEKSDALVKEMLRVKSNLVDFRKSVRLHKHVIEKFILQAPEVLDLDDLTLYYEDLIEKTKELWDLLDNDVSTMDALYESYISLMSYETGQASKALAAMALVIFPTTLVAAVFAMDAVYMPLRGLPGDFYLQLGLVLTVMSTTIYFLKKRKWL